MSERQAALIARIAALDERITELCEQKLHNFVRHSWPVVEVQRPFVDNWHIGAICEHLEAVVLGQIKNLGINVPPSTGKSTIVSVCFPAWVWARKPGPTKPTRLGPGQRFMCAAYDQTQSMRDNMRMRDLVTSDWYTQRWPHVEIRADQNLQKKYATTAGGWRMGISVGAPRMGEHPNYKLIDDPHNPKKQLLSDNEIAAACQWYDYSFKIRGAMLDAATVLIMQRLHEKDLCGHLRATDDSWVWLVLPHRWEPKRMVQLPTGWKDPRDPDVDLEGDDMTKRGFLKTIAQGTGALLWPSEWPEAKLSAQYKPGTWGDAGQYQQRPAPAGGLLFKRDWFKIINARPPGIIGKVRSWDVAGTEKERAQGGTARTVGLRLERTVDAFIITDITKGWWGPDAVDTNIKQTAQLDESGVRIREEQEPGSSGKDVINARRKMLAGYDYRGLSKRHDKITSAKPARSQAEGGNCYILIPLLENGEPDPKAQKMAMEFLDEIELFPAGSLKDQVDAFTQGLNVLTGVAEPLEIVTGYETPQLTQAEQDANEAEARAEAERVVLEQIASNGVYWPGGH